jgi:transcription antitermination factor NusG
MMTTPPPEQTPDTQPSQALWYALRSKPNKEAMLERELISRDIEVYFPRLRVNPVNPRSRKWVPYFPGYLFVKVDLAAIGINYLNRVPNANKLVMFGDYIPSVSEALLRRIDIKLAAIAEAGGQSFFDIQPGERVEISHGVFAGYEGIFEERLKGDERVRVLLKMLSDRYVPVEVDAGWVTKRDKKR